MPSAADFGVFTAETILLDAHNKGLTQGFAYFGPAHLAWVAGCAVLITACVRWYRHLRKQGATGLWLLRAMAAVMLCCRIVEDALKVATGTMSANWLPLHFCNFAMLAGIVYAVRPNAFCRELLLTLGLSGGFVALLFPGWTYCPPWTWPVIAGFTEHALLFAISMCAVSDWQSSPRWRDLLYTFAFVACYAVFFRWFNPVFDTNFGFVTQPVAGTPLAWWAADFGNPGYLVPFALAFACGAVALHAAVAFQRHIGARRERERQ